MTRQNSPQAHLRSYSTAAGALKEHGITRTFKQYIDSQWRVQSPESGTGGAVVASPSVGQMTMRPPCCDSAILPLLKVGLN
ncbi:hypothetical protein Mapa_003147 [Marchantia paleacea]|nr:hypothetical protein Mapa_003147 [Marchantia paleacea]